MSPFKSWSNVQVHDLTFMSPLKGQSDVRVHDFTAKLLPNAGQGLFWQQLPQEIMQKWRGETTLNLTQRRSKSFCELAYHKHSPNPPLESSRVVEEWRGLLLLGF